MPRSHFLATTGATVAAAAIERVPLAAAASDAGPGLRSAFAEVRGIRMHYVTAGSGPPLVLLAGWPQTWYAWRKVIPLMATRFSVIVPDLRGQGDSQRTESGYDTANLAADVHALVQHLGFSSIDLVGHDVGAWVAYAYAASYRAETKAVALLDAAIPGVTPQAAFGLSRTSKTWQFVFHAVPDIPEMLTAGREREYLGWFFHTKAARPDAIDPEAIDRYVRAYSVPGGMKSGFAYYRAVFDDIDQNEVHRKTPLEMPVLALGGASAVGSALYETMKTAATNVSGGAIDQCGHYIPEEQPDKLAARLLAFFPTGA